MIITTACPYCGGTGEHYDYGWRGANCAICEGWGVLVVVDSKHFPFGPNGSTYRNERGQFCKIPLPPVEVVE